MRAKGKWFNISLASDGRGKIEISGPIAGDSFWSDAVSAKAFISELREIGESTPVDVYIQSPGGEVTEGLAIHNALKDHKGEVVVKVRGLAASMASVIAMAADRVEMPAESYLMIHRVSGGVWGNTDDLRNASETVEKMEKDIINIYAKRTGLSEDQISGMLAKDTYLNGAEALELGFADVVVNDQPKATQALTMNNLKGALCAGLMVPTALLDLETSGETDVEETAEDSAEETEETETAEAEPTAEVEGEETEQPANETEPDPVEPTKAEPTAEVPEPGPEVSTEGAEGEPEAEASGTEGESGAEGPEGSEGEAGQDGTESALARLFRVVKDRIAPENPVVDSPETAAADVAIVAELQTEITNHLTKIEDLEGEVNRLQSSAKNAEEQAALLISTFGFGEDELEELPSVIEDGGTNPDQINARIDSLNEQIRNEADNEKVRELIKEVRALRVQLETA